MARSALHERIYTQITQSNLFQAYKVLEEVIVKDLFPSYISTRDRYDIVLPDLQLIIEAHGEQHYQPVAFSGKAEEAVLNFQLQKERDWDKKEVALLNKWSYLEIPFSEQKTITADQIYERYKSCPEYQFRALVKLPVPPKFISVDKQIFLDKAREWRKEQRKKVKEYKSARTKKEM